MQQFVKMPKVVEALATAAKSRSPVDGLTHNFYRYPARFSPEFVRAAIQHFTQPGDLVLDPFMGSGTTLVEAISLGRSAIGVDINSLSVFIARSKTSIYSEQVLLDVQRWLEQIIPTLSVRCHVRPHREWSKNGYHDNINNQSTWRIRKLLQVGINALACLPDEQYRDFARCVFLKTAQWALDCREKIPTTAEFREKLLEDCGVLAAGAREFQAAAQATSQNRKGVTRPFVKCLHRSAIGLDSDYRVTQKGPPKLILTSPPYPGVHVLYHRWQVRGRRETPAPYWIANQLDGNGASYYTFGDRKQKGLRSYYETLGAAFTSLAKLAARDTLVVQMVSFAKAGSHLERYLQTMKDAGFEESIRYSACGIGNRRLWREVPNRKWYANLKGSTSSSKEVVLLHKLAKSP